MMILRGFVTTYHLLKYRADTPQVKSTHRSSAFPRIFHGHPETLLRPFLSSISVSVIPGTCLVFGQCSFSCQSPPHLELYLLMSATLLAGSSFSKNWKLTSSSLKWLLLAKWLQCPLLNFVTMALSNYGWNVLHSSHRLMPHSTSSVEHDAIML